MISPAGPTVNNIIFQHRGVAAWLLGFNVRAGCGTSVGLFVTQGLGQGGSYKSPDRQEAGTMV